MPDETPSTQPAPDKKGSEEKKGTSAPPPIGTMEETLDEQIKRETSAPPRDIISGAVKRARGETPEEIPSLQTKQEEKATEKSATDGMGFFSPIAIIMFLIAGLLDATGLIFLILSFFGIGIALSYIPDIIGLVFLGSLMYFTTGSMTTTKGAQKTIKKATTKLLKRLGLAFLGEIIPFFGDIAPCWILAVYFHLKNN